VNILFLSSSKGQLCSLSLKRPLHLIALLLLVGGLTGGSAYWGYQLNSGTNDQKMVDSWQQELHQQQVRLKHIQQESDASVEVLSSRLGLLQAHVMRLDALGRKLINMASIDQGEFDFDSTPAVGGPETTSQKTPEPLELSTAIDQLKLELENRENQLLVLENLVMNNNLQKEVKPSGRPIKKGWLSSYYGMRTHPLSGRKEMHKGIDFASKMGGEVIAVAKGVVTYSGKRWGYGKVIDVAHGNGYTTRYAHNSRLLVSVGDTVEKGFRIAEIGSSGRSTGPHVHFEVLKDGRQINPMKFITSSN
jgi:murein DD-endopeptidase MepM/ murein hydrolase activator NlpD